MDMKQLLEMTARRGASDLHLMTGYPPVLRIDGVLLPVPGEPVLTPQDVEVLVFSILSSEQKDLFLANKEIDFSYGLGSARFRANIYYQKASLGAALRYLPQKIRTIEELFLPEICYQFVNLRRGFILVTGPTGHGKSTTLAAILNEINKTRNVHIVTIEDPIEYVYPKARSIVSQREMHTDTHSWNVALRSVLREDPDVVLVGEMRDYETIAAALTVAETGHLVFATLHTNSAAQTIDRIVDVFPERQQAQIRLQLSGTLEAVFSQRLIPAIGGGRRPATEILIATPAVQTSIREGKTHLIDNIIQTSADMGMSLLEVSLAQLVKKGAITLDTAKEYALRPEELIRLFAST
ncbi:type IV pili twitching motility protein PilT [Candidatus Gottesmanbacteria bacterium RIFCSPHIGHO2_01_FULL_43_15]|nr:MAG: type IV pili twitching motility protein PilT [Candidatus Gottesmanbacteria bacterium RIFCSPHIGHO2_01_FULL_43_15]